MNQVNSNIPIFNRKYICIADWMHADLASVVSSYLHQEGTFLSVFEFPSVSIRKPEEYTEAFDEHYLSRVMGEEQSIKIHNGIKKIGGCEHLILIGLNEKQISYLTYLKEYNIIEINSFNDVELYLETIETKSKQFLSIKSNEYQIGLLSAGRNNLKLRIDNTAKSVTNDYRKSSGLLVIENYATVSVTSAINFALSLNLDVKIISPIVDDEYEEIKNLVVEWKNGNNAIYSELHAKLFGKLDDIDFSSYKFVTFFTVGVPYSIILKNQIPCSYVHLDKYPTIFIVDNIFYENRDPIGSSVLFSPLEFGIDDETVYTLNTFERNNYFVKRLIGKNATAYNIDMCVKEYPYDFFHICSHGGEVNGFTVIKEFFDRTGKKHVVEYDEILSFYPEKGREKIKVEHKYIWRKFDEFIWKSKELKAQHYPAFVFADMMTAVSMDGKSSKKYSGIPKASVPGSCSIKCSDFIYQAMFNNIASVHTSPIVFNNTCWSWSGISDAFLSSGVRGYIGTLWAINNKVAIEAAEVFYDNVFNDTVMNMVYAANATTRGTDSEFIYVYWGLHFSTIKKMNSVEESRNNIAKCLLSSGHKWMKKANSFPDGEIKNESLMLSEWNTNELLKNFVLEAKMLLEH